MSTSIGFEKGKSYYCGYWERKHTIIDILENGDIVSLWHSTKYEKEHTTIHRTAFHKRRDKML